MSIIGVAGFFAPENISLVDIYEFLSSNLKYLFGSCKKPN